MSPFQVYIFNRILQNRENGHCCKENGSKEFIGLLIFDLGNLKFDGNKAKKGISKRVFQEKKAGQFFGKQRFLTL